MRAARWHPKCVNADPTDGYHCDLCMGTHGEHAEHPRTYRCKGCSAFVPWCYGGDDRYFAFCDACAVRRMATDRHTRREHVHEALAARLRRRARTPRLFGVTR